ncbi:MAG: hypothetical protein K2X82_13460 [Gemmataceae bacterium]|nr:hypothetical protein [Gemmataceae bacterium]
MWRGGGLIVAALLASAGRAEGVTFCNGASVTKAGTGPWTVLAKGTCELDAAEKGLIGFQYYDIDPNANNNYGFTNTPKGPPAPGGGPKDWTGNSMSLSAQGAYTSVFVMHYVDAQTKGQFKAANQPYNLP